MRHSLGAAGILNDSGLRKAYHTTRIATNQYFLNKELLQWSKESLPHNKDCDFKLFQSKLFYFDCLRKAYHTTRIATSVINLTEEVSALV